MVKVLKGEKVMEKVCPACNKLAANYLKCNICGAVMKDYGRAQEVYMDDYTANMPIHDGVNYCMHVFKCESCGNQEIIQVNKIII